MEALRTYAEEGENFGRVWRYDVSHPFLDSPPGGTAYAMTGILPLDCTMVGADFI